MNTTRIRLAAALTAFAAGAAVITACGTDAAPAADSAASSADAHAGHAGHGHSVATSTGSSSAGESASAAAHSDADVDFATMMYPHHAQAVEMAELVDGKGASAEVGALAAEIKRAQQPEMDAFTRLLESWGAPAPSATMSHAMDGMMTPEQMTRLGTLRGAEFDREWLTMMIEHHRGAIDMADAELASGTNSEARSIATDIKRSQQAEIDRMQALLND